MNCLQFFLSLSRWNKILRNRSCPCESKKTQLPIPEKYVAMWFFRCLVQCSISCSMQPCSCLIFIDLNFIDEHQRTDLPGLWKQYNPSRVQTFPFTNLMWQRQMAASYITQHLKKRIISAYRHISHALVPLLTKRYFLGVWHFTYLRRGNIVSYNIRNSQPLLYPCMYVCMEKIILGFWARGSYS